MAYIDREKLIESLRYHYKPMIRTGSLADVFFDTIERTIDEQPTADVVPRIEYESLRKRMFPSYCQVCTEDEAIKIGYKSGKAKVAKEIFEEADKIFMETCLSLEAYKAWCELKKKYTEGK